MKTSRMILIIIVLVIIFALFLNFAFKRIQTVEMDVTRDEEAQVSDKILGYIDEIRAMSDVEFISGVRFLDDDIQILLVDHTDKAAAMLYEDDYYAVDYGKLDKNLVYCNSYNVYIGKRPAVIINCDEILDDPLERAVVAVYQFKAGGFETLNPIKADYFPSRERDAGECYLRYKMVESLRAAYLNNSGLEEFYFYYRSWVDLPEVRDHEEIIKYDYYDGIKEYLKLKVRQLKDSGYDTGAFIDSFLNEFGIYDKDDEHSVLGLLWCLISERKDVDILQKDRMQSDRYRLLLKDTPYADFEDEDRNGFLIRFNEMVQEIDNLISDANRDMADVVPVELILTAETYEGAAKIDDNHYIYRDYTARDEYGELIKAENMLVRISAYKIEYYIKGK